MYPISDTIKALFEAEQRQVLRITGTDKNGVAINITDENVVLGGFNIDRYSCNGTKLEIGTAIAAEMTLKLDNHDGAFDGVVFEGAELFVEIGIADWTQDNPTINWIPCGYFIPDEQPRSLNIITIHALDRMMNFDAVPPTLTPWTDNNGNAMTDNNGNIIYFMADLAFPCTVEQLINQVAIRCGVPFTQSIAGFPNRSITITEFPVLQQQVTFRNLIQWCAGIIGANAWIDWTGALRFSWYGAATGYVSTTANRFSSDLHENDITITGVKYTNTQDVTIVSGTDDYTIDMTGNYLAASKIADILQNVKNKISGFAYRPFSASVINAPYIWPMDMITFAKDGVNHNCAITNINFGINSTSSIEGKGETEKTNSGIAPSGLTTEQARLIEGVAESIGELDESLDQQNIFNRLTNNGEAQGIYMLNGQLYVNMSYARSGTLALGGVNNNGTLIVYDANDNEIGRWDRNGIVLNKGTISGPSITVGGQNNKDGSIRVFDSYGNIVGTWDNNGINATKGTFSGALNGATGTFSGEVSASSIKGGLLSVGGSEEVAGIIVKNGSGQTIGNWNAGGIYATAGTFSGKIIGVDEDGNKLTIENGIISYENSSSVYSASIGFGGLDAANYGLSIESENVLIKANDSIELCCDYLYVSDGSGNIYSGVTEDDLQVCTSITATSGGGWRADYRLLSFYKGILWNIA